MTIERKNLVLQLLRELRSDVAKLDAKLDETVADLKVALKAELRSLRADLASDMLAFHRQTSEQIGGLRRTVVDYHSTIVGHAFSSATSTCSTPAQRRIARGGA
jgi:hypothetical protein